MTTILEKQKIPVIQEVMIRLNPYSSSKIRQMKKAGYIKNFAFFAEKIVDDEIQKKYKEFLADNEKMNLHQSD